MRKFKKVEISAFRIFDNPNDSIFNLSNDKNEPCDFISLYAPNGFGKTSFYDAVEWGETASFGRLLQRRTQNEKLSNAQNDQNVLEVIRNLNSKFDTYVTITDQDNQVTKRAYSIKKTKKKIDFNQKMDHPFHKVILSQEWITAFLSEYDNTQRYEKFVTIPELRELDQYYKNLVALIDENKKIIEKLAEDISEFDKQIQSVGDNNILEQVNTSIKVLNTHGFVINPVLSITTKEELQQIRNHIANLAVQNKRNLDNTADSLSKIFILQNGDEINIGYETYKEKCTKLEQFNEEIKKLTELDSKFETLQQTKNTLENISLQTIVKSEELEQLQDILIKYSDYSGTVSQLANNHDLYKKNIVYITSHEEQLLQINNRYQKIESLLTVNESKTAKLAELLNSIPSLQEQYYSQTNILNKLREERESLRQKLEANRTKQNYIQCNIRVLEAILEGFLIRDFNIETMSSFCSDDERKDVETQLASIRLLLNQSKIYEDELIELKAEIANIEILNNDIQSFISKGLAIVNTSKSNKCPLCSINYQSYEQLAERIANNSVLGANLQVLLNNQTKLADMISDLEVKTSEHVQSLNKLFRNKLADNTKNLDELKKCDQSIDTQLSSITDKELEINSVLQKNYTQIAEFQIYDFTDLTLKFQELLKSHTTKKNSLIEELKNNSIQRDRISSELMNLKNQNSQIEIANQSLRDNKSYNIVKNWFMQKNITAELSNTIIENEIMRVNQALSDNFEQKEVNEALLEKITIELQQFEHSYIIKKLQLFGNEREPLLRETSTFVMRASMALGIQSLPSGTINLMELFEKRKMEYAKEKSRLEYISDELQKVGKFSEIVESFLISETAKTKQYQLKQDVTIWKEKVAPLLSNEFQNIKEHLSQKIRAFFYEDLINSIYAKIDPHPDFKKVAFVPNYESNKPSLDIFVTNSKGNRISPNLYFSSAQINILSLSIFLASALNNNEYDSIFIDDPIQSMDSINILSTIDLLRSISVNFKKQIILSTHDENFHNLLKKKIPPELFNSKFIELESLGKVKQDNFKTKQQY